MQGLSGSIEVMPLSDLVYYLASRQITGTLECEQGNERKTVLIADGAAVMASSSHPDEYLSNLLVSHGHITSEQVKEAFEQGGSEHLGSVLVSSGVLAEPIVREVLMKKIRSTVLSLLQWQSGTFQFIAASANLERPAVPVAVDLRELCAEGASLAVEHLEARGWSAPASGAATSGDEAHFAEEFRREVESRLAERGRGKRFPKDLQRRAVAYYYTRTQHGSFLSEVARELGLPPPTLRRWVLDTPNPRLNETPEPARHHGLVQHNLTSADASPGEGPSGQPVLVGPGGFRIEGLDLDSLAALLRRLE